MAAVQFKFIEVAKVLLAAGAMVGQGDEDGFTALHYAAMDEHANLSRVHYNSIMEFGFTVNIVRLLLQGGAPCNARTHVGITPLHLVCHYNNIAAVQVLLEQADIDITLQSNEGETPHDMARRQGCSEIVVCLEKHAVQPQS